MKPTTSKTKSLYCAAVLLLLTSFVLTSCTSVSSENAASQRQLYQPPILHLKAGQPIQTVDGIYTPAVDEIWHSPARYEALERESQNLAAALQQK